jgi:hypothetical protein
MARAELLAAGNAWAAEDSSVHEGSSAGNDEIIEVMDLSKTSHNRAIFVGRRVRGKIMRFAGFVILGLSSIGKWQRLELPRCDARSFTAFR